ncbi:MAG: penicillin-binding protein activator LpoB, partial [Treponema sp.]|nr:penicillin-binding protein activator LpoB [Treponema sp.]
MLNRLLKAGFLIFLMISGVAGAFTQTITLDNALRGATDEVANNLRRGNRVAILSMRCSSYRMSNYLMEELTNALVNQRLFTVVDRAQMELIQEEMQFQMSGEVSDASAQAIGQKLGAQAIITGTFDSIGDFYRFRVRVIEIETAAIRVTFSANVFGDSIVQSLMGINSTPTAAAAPGAGAGAGQSPA